MQWSCHRWYCCCYYCRDQDGDRQCAIKQSLYCYIVIIYYNGFVFGFIDNCGTIKTVCCSLQTVVTILCIIAGITIRVYSDITDSFIRSVSTPKDPELKIFEYKYLLLKNISLYNTIKNCNPNRILSPPSPLPRKKTIFHASWEFIPNRKVDPLHQDNFQFTYIIHLHKNHIIH